jgi:hypothetical protein
MKMLYSIVLCALIQCSFVAPSMAQANAYGSGNISETATTIGNCFSQLVVRQIRHGVNFEGHLNQIHVTADANFNPGLSIKDSVSNSFQETEVQAAILGKISGSPYSNITGRLNFLLTKSKVGQYTCRFADELETNVGDGVPYDDRITWETEFVLEHTLYIVKARVKNDVPPMGSIFP